MSDDAPELPDIRFGVARLRAENFRAAVERAEQLRRGDRGFGSPLRRWVREERARENASFAVAMTAEERAASPLLLGMPFRRIETRTMTVPSDTEIRDQLDEEYRRAEISRKHFEGIYEDFRVYALRLLREELSKLPEVEDDGFVTVHPRPA